MAWSPDNEHFASGGMDMMVYVWTVNDADKRLKIPGEGQNSFQRAKVAHTHPEREVSGVI